MNENCFKWRISTGGRRDRVIFLDASTCGQGQAPMESRCIGRNAAHNTQPHRETAWTSGLEGMHALYARRNDRQPRCALRCGRTARIVGGSKSMLVITDPRTYLSVCLGAVHVVQHLPGPQPLKRLLHCHHTLVLQQHNMGCGRVGCDMRGMYTLSQKCDTVLQQRANPAIQTTGQAQTPLEEALLLPDLHTPTWMRACIFRAAEHVGVRPGGQLHPPITLPLASHHPPITLPLASHHPPIGLPSPSHHPPIGLPSPSHWPPITLPSPSHWPPITLPSFSHHPPITLPSFSHHPPITRPRGHPMPAGPYLYVQRKSKEGLDCR